MQLMKYILMTLTIMLLLVGCQNDSPVIMQEPSSEPHTDDVELVEEQLNEEMVEMIEFQVNEQVIRLAIKQLPILNHYLAQHKNRRQAIEAMTLEPLTLEESDRFYLLSFACDGPNCSYLIIDTKTQQSHLIADQTQLSQLIETPFDDTLVFRFSKDITEYDGNLMKDRLVAFNFEDWEEKPFNANQEDSIVSSMQQYEQSLLNFQFNAQDELVIETIPVNLVQAHHLELTAESLANYSQHYHLTID